VGHPAWCSFLDKIVRESDIISVRSIQQEDSKKRGMAVSKPSKLSCLLFIALLHAGSSMADPAMVQENSLDGETVIQSQPVSASHSTGTRGDLNLDGIPFSIADWVMTSTIGCLCDPDPCLPYDVQEQADLNCDGVVQLGDASPLMAVLLGEDLPFGCPTSPSADIDRPVRHQSVAASETYVVEIRDQLLAGVDTGWIEVVLLEAPESMTGFQFNVEFDSDRLEFVDAMLGDQLEGWLFDPAWFTYVDNTAPSRSCLRIVGSYCSAGQYCPDPAFLPDLPATLAKLEFRVRSPEGDFVTDLNFAWDYCYDNGISVGPEYWACGLWPYHLAVSDSVYNASGDNITGSDDRYGGAGNDCLVGGSRDIPIRQIDFHSGTLSYQQNCCVGRVGDANRQAGDEPTISDISMLIDAKFIATTCDGMIACLAEADVNQSGGAVPSCDDITISDIAILIDYLFITGPTLGLPGCL